MILINKHMLRFLIGLLILLNLILLILRLLFDISLLKDEWYFIVLSIDFCILFINYLHSRSIYKSKRIISIVSVFGFLICIFLFLRTSQTTFYNYMYSPDLKHKVILKETHGGYKPSATLNFYEQHILFFKSKIGNPYAINGFGSLLALEMSPSEGNIFKGSDSYAIGFYALNWIDNNTFTLSYESPSGFTKKTKISIK